MLLKEVNRWGRTPWKIAFRAKSGLLPEHVDLAIIGGGFTGLTAAYVKRGNFHAKDKGAKKSVLLLEAGRFGNGASGRTGGMAQTSAGGVIL